jgi:hypothetical protein
VAKWSQLVETEIGTAGAYLFGSLVYRDGAQFIDSSDVDLVILIPPDKSDAAARKMWLLELQKHKGALEQQLAVTMGRAADAEPISSVVAATRLEIEADVHKDGAEGFFSSNRFLDLLDGSSSNALPNAGEHPISDRLVKQCLRFAQKKRNAFLAINAAGTMGPQPWEGVDPIPKDVMRHAAMAWRLRVPEAEVGAEYDTKEGLDFLSRYLYDLRTQGPPYLDLHDWLSVRRNARGTAGPLQSEVLLLLAEIIWDLAIRGLQAKQAEEAKARATRRPRVPGGLSTVFFADRFAQAFPGVRGTSWFEDPGEIKMRLSKLLEEPLVFPGARPIWWWRGPENLHIEHFRPLDGRLFLMDNQEWQIRRIAAVCPGPYKANFVYVETDAMLRTGLYSHSDDGTARRVGSFGYDSEGYGLTTYGHLVTRAEYDDGAATIGGSIVDIRGKVELRVRYLTPFNLLIAGQGSPINNNCFDRELGSGLID